jgi:hypothetical protein
MTVAIPVSRLPEVRTRRQDPRSAAGVAGGDRVEDQLVRGDASRWNTAKLAAVIAASQARARSSAPVWSKVVVKAPSRRTPAGAVAGKDPAPGGGCGVEHGVLSEADVDEGQEEHEIEAAEPAGEGCSATSAPRSIAVVRRRGHTPLR